MVRPQKVKALLFMKAHSERVPGKNVRRLHGRPLFHWILDSLNQSQVVEEIIINTDSDEIANSARKYFDVTIHMRPEYLLNIDRDEANQIIKYDLEHAEGDVFIQTHSTNPLITPATIKNAVDLFWTIKDEYDSLFSVTSIQKRLYDHMGVGINHDPNNLIKTQDMKPVYEENSCIYLFMRKNFLNNTNRIGKKPYLFPISSNEAVDIDDENDFLIAESMMSIRQNRKNLLNE